MPLWFALAPKSPVLQPDAEVLRKRPRIEFLEHFRMIRRLTFAPDVGDQNASKARNYSMK